MELQDLTQRDFLNALMLAKRRGDENAVQGLRTLFTQWQQQRDTAENDPLNEMGTFNRLVTNFGGGAHEIVLGTKQLLGMAPRDEVLEDKARMDKLAASVPYAGRAAQMVGAAAITAPLAVPAVALAPYASAPVIGAGSGAVMGLLTPTTDENIVRGKGTNATVGALTGAALAKGSELVREYAPAAWNRILDAWAKAGLPGASPERQAHIAERAVVEALPKSTVPGQSAAEAARLKLMGYQEQVPGVTTSTASVLKDPALLQVEAAARETGGPAGAVLKAQELTNNAARWNALRPLDRGPQAPADIQAAASEAFEKGAAELKPRGVIDPQGRLVSSLDDLIDRYSQTPKIATPLKTLRESLAKALEANEGKGNTSMLHDVRQFQIDDVVAQVRGENMPKSATRLNQLLLDFKSQFDDTLNTATRGRWGQLMLKYARDITPRDQTAAANELMDKLGTRVSTVINPQTQEAVPNLTNAQRMLRAAAANPLTRPYNTPTFQSQDAATIERVLGDIQRQTLPYQFATPRSMTAFNQLEQGPRGLMSTLRVPPEPIKVSNPVAAAGGAVISAATGGEPLTGAAIGAAGNIGKGWLARRGAEAGTRIAGHASELLANQDMMYQVLERLSREGVKLPPGLTYRILSGSLEHVGTVGGPLATESLRGILEPQ